MVFSQDPFFICFFAYFPPYGKIVDFIFTAPTFQLVFVLSGYKNTIFLRKYFMQFEGFSQREQKLPNAVAKIEFQWNKV